MLRTRAPLSSEASSRIPSDLHVLGLPLAFILSQDQTLHCIMSSLSLTLLLIIESVKISEWWVVNGESLNSPSTSSCPPLYSFYSIRPLFFYITAPSFFALAPNSCRYATWLSIPYKNLSPSPSRFRLYMLSLLTVITFSIFIPKIASGICPVGRPFLLGLQR